MTAYSPPLRDPLYELCRAVDPDAANDPDEKATVIGLSVAVADVARRYDDFEIRPEGVVWTGNDGELAEKHETIVADVLALHRPFEPPETTRDWLERIDTEREDTRPDVRVSDE